MPLDRNNARNNPGQGKDTAYDVFISYSHLDKDVMLKMCDFLEKNGIRCWYAPRNIMPGQDYGEAIEQAINNVKIFVLIYSGNSLNSDYVKSETNSAFGEKKIIIPFRIETCSMKGTGMKIYLNFCQWIDAAPHPDKGFDTLAAAIISILGSNYPSDSAPAGEHLQTTSGRIAEEQKPGKESAEKNEKALKITVGRRRLVLIAICTLFIGGMIYGMVFRFNKRARPSSVVQDNIGTNTFREDVEAEDTGTKDAFADFIPVDLSKGNAGEIKVAIPGGESIIMARIESGTITISMKDGENGAETKHALSLKHDFYIGRTEVTQSQWNAVMGVNPSYFKGDTLPVEQVSWDDARIFCEKMNRLYAGKLPDGYRFDLPTETQWEYAARGGKYSRGYKYSGSDDPDAVAWHSGGGNINNGTHPVGTKAANELGLYDMSGNVKEWCRDKETHDDIDYLGELRSIRGGSWVNKRLVAYRSSDQPAFQNNDLGFRLALVPVQ